MYDPLRVSQCHSVSGPGSGRAGAWKEPWNFLMDRPLPLREPSLSLGFPLVKWGHADHLSAQPFEEALIELAAGLLAWVWQYLGSTRTLL